MFLTHKTQESLVDRGYSRRQIGRIAKGAAAAIPFFNEFAQAQQAQQLATRRGGGGAPQAYDPDVVRITSNENPMGPPSWNCRIAVAPSPSTRLSHSDSIRRSCLP